MRWLFHAILLAIMVYCLVGVIAAAIGLIGIGILTVLIWMGRDPLWFLDPRRGTSADPRRSVK